MPCIQLERGGEEKREERVRREKGEGGDKSKGESMLYGLLLTFLVVMP